MKRLEELRAYLDSLESDFRKFYDKGNNAAGTRIRKAMQQIKKMASEIRNEIQAIRKQNKENK
ncbi:MAG: hypothetical protein NZL95_07550 [Chitinophagales bacterium]|nr:hypothetical protein [Chitinophagales bacterium]MDW8428390.1 hypothetical protein [Chitinophagales bacterium]